MSVTFHQRDTELALWFIRQGDVPVVDMAELVQHSTIPNLTEATATTMWHNLRRKAQSADSVPADPVISAGVDNNNNSRDTGTENNENEEDVEESIPPITTPANTTPVITAPAITAPAITAPVITAPSLTATTVPAIPITGTPNLENKPGFSAAMAKAKAAKKAQKQQTAARASAARARTSETKKKGTGLRESQV